MYEEVVCYELRIAGIKFCRQKGIKVTYDDVALDIGFRADIIIEDKVIVELKSIEAISPIHPKILLTYLRLTNMRLGLLVNFNIELIKNGISRVVNDL